MNLERVQYIQFQLVVKQNYSDNLAKQAIDSLMSYDSIAAEVLHKNLGFRCVQTADDETDTTTLGVVLGYSLTYQRRALDAKFVTTTQLPITYRPTNLGSLSSRDI